MFFFAKFLGQYQNMIKAYFSSDPKTSLLKVVDDFLVEAIALADQKEQVCLDIMLFSFTDESLADRLQSIITEGKIQLRIIADWGNISNRDDRKLLDLVGLEANNFKLRFKFDLPYIWDGQAQKLRWSYHASLGLLHHKSISLNVDGQPSALLCGSLNWTKTGSSNYENLFRIGSTTKAEKAIVAAMTNEFDALWQHQQLSLPYAKASLLRAKVQQWYLSNPDADYQSMQQHFIKPINTQQSNKNLNKTRLTQNTVLSFSSNDPFTKDRQKGLAATNSYRYFAMQKPSGASKWVPLDIQTASLDLIYSSNPGDEICICMYAFSPRVPEYTAILEMARKGVLVRCILDRKSNRGMIQKLRDAAREEGLGMRVKAGTRGMHQKYMVNLKSASLVCGTANMSTDSFYRHFEHRLLIRRNKRLAQAFQKDFERIWERVAD